METGYQREGRRQVQTSLCTHRLGGIQIRKTFDFGALLVAHNSNTVLVVLEEDLVDVEFTDKLNHAVQQMGFRLFVLGSLNAQASVLSMLCDHFVPDIVKSLVFVQVGAHRRHVMTVCVSNDDVLSPYMLAGSHAVRLEEMIKKIGHVEHIIELYANHLHNQMAAIRLE